jgi:uncharacterized damage-inducible protein DinB
MATTQSAPVSESTKQTFLDVYEKEHATTMRVLRAYPPDKLELRPHENCRTARELAWVFVMERGLGIAVYKRELEKLLASGPPPEPPETWQELLAALEHAHKEFGDLIRATPAAELQEKVQFFVGPKQMGDLSRIDWLWFLLHDQIHHRGQFSIYLRAAGGRVPSIYGPSEHEPWM